MVSGRFCQVFIGLLIMVVSVAGGRVTFGQTSIDLKTLIGKATPDVIRDLSRWGIEVSLSEEYDDLLVGYDDGIQVNVEGGIVQAIWIEFTSRRSGAFPLQVDNVITPDVNVNDIIRLLGAPDEKGSGSTIGATDLGGWVKWNTPEYELHCEIIDSKVVMVTIMQP